MYVVERDLMADWHIRSARSGEVIEAFVS